MLEGNPSIIYLSTIPIKKLSDFVVAYIAAILRYFQSYRQDNLRTYALLYSRKKGELLRVNKRIKYVIYIEVRLDSLKPDEGRKYKEFSIIQKLDLLDKDKEYLSSRGQQQVIEEARSSDLQILLNSFINRRSNNKRAIYIENYVQVIKKVGEFLRPIIL